MLPARSLARRQRPRQRGLHPRAQPNPARWFLCAPAARQRTQLCPHPRSHTPGRWDALAAAAHGLRLVRSVPYQSCGVEPGPGGGGAAAGGASSRESRRPAAGGGGSAAGPGREQPTICTGAQKGLFGAAGRSGWGGRAGEASVEVQVSMDDATRTQTLHYNGK